MKPGLTSITFRNKTIEEIVTITKESGLSCIEWGSDVHCKPEHTESAQLAKKQCDKNGISICSYGTYLRLGLCDDAYTQFEEICKIADILGTSIVRIWASDKNMASIDCEQYQKCIFEARTISEIASRHGITVCFEYHRRTLTEKAEDALKLIKDIGRENIRLYWQPNPDISIDDNIRELKTVLPYVENIHCFYWTKNSENKDVRNPLSDGTHIWKKYISIAHKSVKNILIEFVKDQSVEQLFSDAAILKDLVK